MIRFGSPSDDEQPEDGEEDGEFLDAQTTLDESPASTSDSLKEELADFSEEQVSDQLAELADRLFGRFAEQLKDQGILRPPPASPEELAATTGTLIVLGAERAKGVLVQAVDVQTGKSRRAVISQQLVAGERQMAAVLPRIPAGEWDLFDYRHFAQIDVINGEVTIVDWR